MNVQPLVPLCPCPKCGVHAVVLLTPEQRLAQPDDTTHVCHPLLGGCNHGFTDDRTREPDWCPHCNGYGSSLREASARCTQCGGSGLRRRA